MDTVFQNNSAISIGSGSEIEPEFAPALSYLVDPTMVNGKERGGVMVNRYQDGVLTSNPLWPWPNEDLIHQHLCNSDDLLSTSRVNGTGAGWEPAWCASGKTLTYYIWEYLGNSIPIEISN